MNDVGPGNGSLCRTTDRDLGRMNQIGIKIVWEATNRIDLLQSMVFYSSKSSYAPRTSCSLQSRPLKQSLINLSFKIHSSAWASFILLQILSWKRDSTRCFARYFLLVLTLTPHMICLVHDTRYRMNSG